MTDHTITQLAHEAGMAGDLAMVVMCEVALWGAADECHADEIADDPDARRAARMTQQDARAECARVIADAAAQQDAV